MKNNFKELYDGLHATSDLKHKWFKQFIDIVRAEINYTLADSSCVRVVQNSTSDTFGKGGDSDSSLLQNERCVVLKDSEPDNTTSDFVQHITDDSNSDSSSLDRKRRKISNDSDSDSSSLHQKRRIISSVEVDRDSDFYSSWDFKRRSTTVSFP